MGEDGGGGGGDVPYLDVTITIYPGGGGGGAGGTLAFQVGGFDIDGKVLLQAEDGFDFGIPRIDARGGTGGLGRTGTTLYNEGGDGGDGVIILRSKKKIEMPALDNPMTALFGDGSFTGGEFRPTREGVSVWYDSGAVAPTFVSRTMLD